MIVDSLPSIADLGPMPEFVVRCTSVAPMRTPGEHGSKTSDGTQSEVEVEDLFETRRGS
jgi:hypothetical protein